MKKSNIEELIKLIKDTSITEVSWSEGDAQITLKQAVAGSVAPAQFAAPPVLPASESKVMSEAENPVVASNLHEVKSPMVGTFYEAPNPEEPAFVKVGDKVKKGQVLCIIEAMKLMNEIESDADGTLEEICLTNESPVEYDTVLFRIA